MTACQQEQGQLQMLLLRLCLGRPQQSFQCLRANSVHTCLQMTSRAQELWSRPGEAWQWQHLFMA